MLEYSQFVEKMSKDVFDANFLNKMFAGGAEDGP
jgi:hypothetical protein